MQIMDVLQQLGGIQSVARELNINETQAAGGAAALIPAILGGFKKQAQAHPAGLDGLAGVLNGLGGGGLLDNVLGAQPTDVNRGNDVLGQIFGSRDVSRAVAQNAATSSGLDPALLKKMLPMLAMLVGGYMARQGSASAAAPAAAPGGGLIGQVLGGLFGNRSNPASGATSAAGGLGSLLDLNHDGNPLDDILGMVGKLQR
jgi:hypothetical protein